MDKFNQSAELLCTMSPKIKHKLKPGQKQFRRVAGASILALKKNIRRSSLCDKSVHTVENCDLNLESTTSTESCDSEKWKLNILNQTPIVISDTDSESGSSCTDKHELEARNFKNCSLPSDKVNDIECWIEKVNAENENDTTTYSELSTIHGSESGKNFLPKEKGAVVNSTFVSKNCKRFEEFFRPKPTHLQGLSNSLDSGDNEDVILSSENLIIEDSFQCSDQSLTRLEKKVQTKDKSTMNDKKSTPTKTLVGEDLEIMLDKLYGMSWRQKQELILPKTEPRKNITKSRTADIMHSERKPKSQLFRTEEAEVPKTNNLLQKLQNGKVKKNVNSSLISKLKALCDSDTNSENSPGKPCPKTRLDFGDESSDEVTNDPKTSKYFKSNPTIRNYDPREDSPDKENFDISDLGESLEERIRKKINDKTKAEGKSTKVSRKVMTSGDEKNCKKQLPQSNSRETYSPSNSSSTSNSNDKTKAEGKSTKISRKVMTSGDEKNCKKQLPQSNSRETYSPSNSSSTSNSDDETGRLKFVTKRRVEKPIANFNVSISSDEWNLEISKIHRKTELHDGTYSFLASLSGNIPIAKCDMSARIYRNNFKTFKDQLLSKLFKMYNEKVFDNALPPDMPIEWSDRMTHTAGYCYCKKITRRTGKVERSARLVLSTKVIDSAQRMRDTLIHELCHAASWLVNCIRDGHGPYWKSWAFKAMEIFPELPPIKRCHDYAISTKYTYKCTGCGYSIGRHTKSLDVERKRCGYCYGKFEILINKTTKKGETKLVPATPKKEATGFALFVKENYGNYKTPGRKHGDVMKLLGQKFQQMKVNPT